MKKRIAISLATLLLILGAGCSGKDDAPAAEAGNALTVASAADWDNVSVATWNDASLSQMEYTYFLRTTQYDVENQVMADGSYTADTIGEFWAYSEEGADNMEKMLRDQSIVDALHYATLYQMAKEAGTQVDAATIEQGALSVENGAAALSDNPEEAAQLFLERYGVTPQQMKDIYERMDYINRYLFDVSVNAQFSEEELNAAYEADPAAYNRVTVRHVLIMAGDDMTEEERQAAKEKADAILAQVREGADIGQLAAEHSEDPGSKENNGEYTFAQNENYVAEFKDWAFGAEEGDSDVVKTDYGYHVMQLVHRFQRDELMEDVRTVLGDAKADQAIQDAMAIAENDWTVDQAALDRVPLQYAKAATSASEAA